MGRRRRATEMHWTFRIRETQPQILSPTQLLAARLSRASIRKIQLLRCVVLRYAPFDMLGRTIWQILPKCSWFEDHLCRGYVPGSPFKSMTMHEAIEVVERFVDGQADDPEVNVAIEVLSRAAYQ